MWNLVGGTARWERHVVVRYALAALVIAGGYAAVDRWDLLERNGMWA